MRLHALHDASPFPVRGGSVLRTVELGAGMAPWWIVEIAYVRRRAIADYERAGGGICDSMRGALLPPPLELIRQGGIRGVELLDLLCGGDGRGSVANLLHDRCVAIFEVNLAPRLIVVGAEMTPRERFAFTGSGAPFPIRGGRVSDGTGVDAGTIPRWLAEYAYGRYCMIMRSHGGEPLRIEEIERRGGLDPFTFLDLVAGGLGDGRALREITYRNKSALDPTIAAPAIMDTKVSKPSAYEVATPIAEKEDE